MTARQEGAQEGGVWEGCRGQRFGPRQAISSRNAILKISRTPRRWDASPGGRLERGAANTCSIERHAMPQAEIEDGGAAAADAPASALARVDSQGHAGRPDRGQGDLADAVGARPRVQPGLVGQGCQEKGARRAKQWARVRLLEIVARHSQEPDHGAWPRRALIGGPQRSACEKNRRASARRLPGGAAARRREIFFFWRSHVRVGAWSGCVCEGAGLGAPDLAGPGVGSSLLRRGARCCAGHLENAWQALNPPALVPSLSPPTPYRKPTQPSPPSSIPPPASPTARTTRPSTVEMANEVSLPRARSRRPP